MGHVSFYSLKKVQKEELKERLRKAAAQLWRERRPVNIAALARKTEMKYGTLFDLITYTVPEIRVELEFEHCSRDSFNYQQILRLLQQAVAMILRSGDKPCVASLAHALGWSGVRLRRTLKKHVGLVKFLGLYTDTQVVLWRAGRAIRFSGEPVTYMALVHKTEYSYNTVRKILKQVKRDPSFAKGIALQTHRKNSGVIAHLQKCKRTAQ